MRLLRVGLWGQALLIGLTATAQAPPPAVLLGAFVDDYGIRYVVSEASWRQGEYARYAISEWNVEERFLIASPRGGRGSSRALLPGPR